MQNRFQNLKVVEVQMFKKGSQIGELSYELLESISAFRPESCARQVYIFFDIIDTEKFQKTILAFKEKTRSCLYYEGFSAYQFLLSWIAGREYKELKPQSKLQLYNDNHILGRFKNEFAKFKVKCEPELLKKFLMIVEPLLTDAHCMRKFIEDNTDYRGEKLRTRLDIFINNICFSRRMDFDVIHEAASSDPDVYLQALHDNLENKIETLSKQMHLAKFDNVTFFENTAKREILNKYTQCIVKRLELRSFSRIVARM